MFMNFTTLGGLTDRVISQMEELDYSVGLTAQHKSVYRKLQAYAQEHPVTSYDEAYGEQFLRDVYRFVPNTKSKSWSRSQRYAHSAIGKLWMYQTQGKFGFNTNNKCSADWALEDKDLLEAHVISLEPLDAVSSKRPRKFVTLEKFYRYLATIGIAGIKHICSEDISLFTHSIQDLSKRYIRAIIKDLRHYLRFAWNNGYTETDWSACVPRITAPDPIKVPAIWSETEVSKLLSSVDRSTSAGKRDYAVLLLISSLGLRSSDVSKLRLSDINWQHKEIALVQPKTGVLSVCPISDDIGWALIDYLRYGRPNRNSPNVFLTAVAPFGEFGESTARHILERYIVKSDIPVKPLGVARGTHSLRHSFARKMLNHNVPLEMISDMLGHTQLVSLSPYLKVDTDGLRECALSLGEVVNA